MNVLHVYRTYFPDSQGGLEETIRQICLNTRSQGVESRVFTLSDGTGSAVIESGEARVIRVRKTFEIASNSVALGALGQFRRQVEWADLVHYHFPWPWADVLHAMAGNPRPSLITYHSDIVRQRLLAVLYRPLMMHFLRSVNRIVATSPNYLATSEILGRFDDKVDVIPIGINREAYPDSREIEDAAVHTERMLGRDFFLFVGVLRYYKGLHILLEAIRNAPYRVVIAGAGPIEGELRAQAEALGLDNVHFCGHVDDDVKMALFRLSRAVVFPSYLRSEAFGVTLLEGAMSGKPLISAEVGTGTSHINIDQKTGLVVTPGCPVSLRAAMDRLYENPEEAKAMGANALKRYERLFTGVTMGKRYAALYRELLANRGSRVGAALERSE